MDDYTSDPNPAPLDIVHLRQLRELVDQMTSHQGPWGEWDGEQIRPGVYTMPYVIADDLAYEAMHWLYESNRVFWFAWAEWDEGREIFASWQPNTADTLDHVTVRKLITAIARNDRFCEGAWTEFFEDGQGQALFARLLELEEHLASSSA